MTERKQRACITTARYAVAALHHMVNSEYNTVIMTAYMGGTPLIVAAWNRHSSVLGSGPPGLYSPV